MSFGKDERKGIVALSILAILIILISLSLRMCGTAASAGYMNNSGETTVKESVLPSQEVLYQDSIGGSAIKSDSLKKTRNRKKLKRKKTSTKGKTDRTISAQRRRNSVSTNYRDILKDTIPGK